MYSGTLCEDNMTTRTHFETWVNGLADGAAADLPGYQIEILLSVCAAAIGAPPATGAEARRAGRSDADQAARTRRDWEIRRDELVAVMARLIAIRDLSGV